jgi:hypothetical protein
VGLLALVDTYDWSRIALGPVRERLAHLVQKLGFHGRNVLLLSGGDRRLFLLGKARWAAAWAAARWERRGLRDGRGSFPTFHTLVLQYVPGFYPGRVTSFQSRSVYARYRDHVLSPRVHADAVEVEEIPVYPGGILAEPFVRLLAERILERLDAPSGRFRKAG